jgi:drug/metabolite transporter (DMT)-like permease
MNTTPSKRQVLLFDAGLFYAAAIWGSTFFIVKEALSDVDPVTMVGYRFLIAGLVLLVFVKATGRPLFKDIGKAVLLSIILTALYGSQTIGLGHTTASNSGFITGLFVLFVPIFMRSIFRKQPTIMEWVASAISLSGLWILTGGLRDINFGDIITLVSAVTYALHVLYSDKYMKAGVDPFTISCQQFLLVGVISLVAAALFDLPFGVASTHAWGIIVFLALFPSLSAFVIQMIAQRYTSPLKVSLIFALEPVFAAIFAWTLGGEQVVAHRAIGGLLIFVALVVSGLPAPGRRLKEVA